MTIREIHGHRFTELTDRTPATLQRGDVIRAATSINDRDHTYQYVRVMSTRQEIGATRRKRGLPFHRVPSVLATVRGYNGDPPEAPENMREGASGPYFIHWFVREGRNSSGEQSWQGTNGPVYNYDCWKFDTDERFTVWRPCDDEWAQSI